MATEKMIRSLAKELATLIAKIDRDEDNPNSHEGDSFRVSDPAKKQTKYIMPKKTNKKD